MKHDMFKLEPWVQTIIVDPLSKEPLSLDEQGNLTSPYGRKYPVINGTYDLRLLNNQITSDQVLWNECQTEYERSSNDVIRTDKQQDYLAEIEGVRDVYRDLPIVGRCLDVGGHQGRLRYFLSPKQQYITCDPYLDVFKNINAQPNLLKAYPFLLEPVNFICCDAEFLPFMSSSFDVVHMRSVIDHFLNPELALNEAYRVLRNNASLIVGLYVHGGRSGKPTLERTVKDGIKHILQMAGVNAFRDYHVWHPTAQELTGLIDASGFSIDKVHWQKGYNDTVCYIRGIKRMGLTRTPASKELR